MAWHATTDFELRARAPEKRCTSALSVAVLNASATTGCTHGVYVCLQFLA
jgi:hypothetical protein